MQMIAGAILTLAGAVLWAGAAGVSTGTPRLREEVFLVPGGLVGGFGLLVFLGGVARDLRQRR